MRPSDESGYRAGVSERMSRLDDLAAAVDHLQTGGKATRARCVQLVGEAFGVEPTDARIASFSHAVELLHLGTLIHDDILDAAEQRRGRSSVHVEYGAKVAVLAGDVAVSRSGCMIADLGSIRLCRKFAAVLAELCEGELLQDDQRWNPDLTMPAYLGRLARKTGGLFELACEGAAVIAGAGNQAADRAGRFGRDLGCLFQMVDDLLDTTRDSAALGKPAGRDLEAGCLTLEVVLALEDPGNGSALRSRIAASPSGDSSDLARWLTAPRLQERTRQILDLMGQMTLEGLGGFPRNPASVQLAILVEGLLATGQRALSAGLEPLAAG